VAGQTRLNLLRSFRSCFFSNIYRYSILKGLVTLYNTCALISINSCLTNAQIILN